MSASFLGFTIIRASELRAVRAEAAAAREARERIREDPVPVTGTGPGDPAAPVREVIRLADGLLDLTGDDASTQQASVILRWVEARAESLLAACEVVPIEEAGRFDPSRHQAVARRTAPRPELLHQIAETVRPGYARHDTMLRPQQVVVYAPADQAPGA